ncbi:MAG: hypothetical protein LCH26_04710 [Proteobacteria bacterium]|nr:hypothetical protein [Pseudomonadota bacterium]
MQRKTLMTAAACFVTLWAAQVQATSQSAQGPVRVSAQFNAFPEELHNMVTFVMPDGTDVVRQVSAKRRVSLNDAYVGVVAGGQIRYKIETDYAELKDEGVCKLGSAIEKNTKKLEAIRLNFTILAGKKPNKDNMPWFTCQVFKKYQD